MAQSSINIGELVKVLDIEFILVLITQALLQIYHKSLDVFCSNGIIKIKSLQFPGKKPINSNDLFNAKRDNFSKGDATRIVILGAGSIGGSVANELSSEENDNIVIDNNDKNLEKVWQRRYTHSWKCFVPKNPIKSRLR